MKLYLLRHGESDNNANDDKRCLTAKGKQDITKLALFLKKQSFVIDCILHSTKLRTQQTADILIEYAKLTAQKELSQNLEPYSCFELIDGVIANNKDILIVGHMPYLGKLVAKLITGDENKNIVLIKPGTFITLEKMNFQEWVIALFVTPDSL